MLLGRLMAPVARAITRARQRHLLAALDDRVLRDVGLTRQQVEREIRKSIWTK
jgi:uncharacterized protein YjiS (DUF1127 family)